eukprot:s3541_g9.t1
MRWGLMVVPLRNIERHEPGYGIVLHGCAKKAILEKQGRIEEAQWQEFARWSSTLNCGIGEKQDSAERYRYQQWEAFEPSAPSLAREVPKEPALGSAHPAQEEHQGVHPEVIQEFTPMTGEASKELASVEQEESEESAPLASNLPEESVHVTKYSSEKSASAADESGGGGDGEWNSQHECQKNPAERWDQEKRPTLDMNATRMQGYPSRSSGIPC